MTYWQDHHKIYNLKNRKIESISVLLLHLKMCFFVVIVVVKWNQVQTLTLFKNQFYALGKNSFEFHKKMTRGTKTIYKNEEKDEQQQQQKKKETQALNGAIEVCLLHFAYIILNIIIFWMFVAISFKFCLVCTASQRFSKTMHKTTQYKVDISVNNWRWFSFWANPLLSEVTSVR